MRDGIWDQFVHRVWQFVWNDDLRTVSRVRAVLVLALRTGHMVWREIEAGQLTMRAMSLVYTTLLSLVPLLAVSFSVLKGFGVHDQLAPMLLQVLSPLGDKAVELTSYIVNFVENVRVGLLGSLGLGFLLYTVVSLVQKVERSFNHTWRVRRERSFGRRFSHYLSVLLVGPVLMFTAMGLTATVSASKMTVQVVSLVPAWVLSSAGAMVPMLLVIAAFTFAYMYLPNARVRFRPALIGAVFAGLIWHGAGWGFAKVVVTSTGTAAAIYSSFAILMLFMIWLYLAWLILLTGSSIAFYAQHPEYLGLLAHELTVSNRMKERLAVQCAFVIGQRHYYGLPAMTVPALAEHLRVPSFPVEDALKALADAGVVIPAGDEAETYVPARDLGLIGIDEILNIVRASNESSYLNDGRMKVEPAVDAIFMRLREVREHALDARTLRDLVAAHPPAEGSAYVRMSTEPGEMKQTGDSAQ